MDTLTLGYIFSNLEKTKLALRNQVRFNRSMGLLAIGFIAVTVIQNKRLARLDSEVKELKKAQNEMKERIH